MSIDNPPIPDYELSDRLVVTTSPQLRALADPLPATILDLLLPTLPDPTDVSDEDSAELS